MLLKPHCEGKGFLEIDPSDCVEAAKSAEGGEDREKLAALLQRETRWIEAAQLVPSPEDQEILLTIAKERDTALEETQGDEFRQLYTISGQILSAETWPDEALCPTCDRSGTDSVLDHVRGKIALFENVAQASAKLSVEWSSKSWSQLIKLEELAIEEGETSKLTTKSQLASTGTLSSVDSQTIVSWAKELGGRAQAKLVEIAQAKK